MRYFILLAILMMVAQPTTAQEETPAPDYITGKLTIEYPFGALTFDYPIGLYVKEADYQITIGFDENYLDTITLSLPQFFERFFIPNDTLDIASQNMYVTLADSLGDERPYEEAVSATTIGGYDALYFEMERIATRTPIKIYAYTVDVDGEFFFVSLSSNGLSLLDAIHLADETRTVTEIEMAVMVSIIESMVISEVDADITN
jgi:hypothetical protein